MTLTPFIFLGFFTLGIIAALAVHPRYGLYTYFLSFFMSPNHAWWGDLVPDLRYMLIAGVATLVSMTMGTSENTGMKWTEVGGFKIFIAFVAILYPIYLWAVDPEEHLEGTILYTKHLLICYAIYQTAIDRERIKVLLLIMVVGCEWFGWQVFGKSGRIEGVAGSIADANTLGMHMSTGVMCAGMLFLGFKGRYKWISFFCIPLILNGVIMAGSRGAFLGLLCGGASAAIFCPRKFRAQFSFYSVLAVLLFFMLAHDQFIDRLSSLFNAIDGESELDNSAASRLEIAAYGWEMAKDHPLGAGHKGTRSLSSQYMPAYLLSEGSRSAHNSYMDALVSYGFIGLTLYLMLYFWAAKKLFWLRGVAERERDPELGTLTMLYAAVLGTVFASGMFSNFVFAEVQFWMFALLAATMNLPEVRDRSAANLAPGRHGSGRRKMPRRTVEPGRQERP